MAEWSSEQYLKFVGERTQPAVDLAGRINPDGCRRVLDIGCGPGNSTRVLAEMFPMARVIGADNSEDMLKKARELNPMLEFVYFDACGDFTSVGGEFDLVFSNACIQWIPNHAELLKKMMGLLHVGGTLAVQTPINYEEPIHIIIEKTAASEKWSGKIKSGRVFYNMTPSEHFDVLSEIATDFSMWQTTYMHRMPSHESIMEWYKGTGLRPYLSQLNESDAAEFENDVFEEVRKAYPKQANGEIIFRFPRFFFTAVK